jgi:hypothetical protein
VEEKESEFKELWGDLIMPTYVYECKICQKREEHFFSISKAPAAMRCLTALNHWAVRIVTPIPFRMDKGRLYSNAFGRQFRNEKDQMDYAKHNGFVPVENASTESVEKWDTERAREREEKHYRSYQESVEWTLKNG